MTSLAKILDLPAGEPAGRVEIRGLACDSRKIRPGQVFVALPGTRTDGRCFIDDALHRGAAAIVGEGSGPAGPPVPYVEVGSARQALADMACRLYGHPSRRLAVVGVTGTNGKTTTTFLLRDILRRAGRKPGLLGTVRYEIGVREIPAARTTPEAHELQAMLDEMVREGCDSAVMEVSSHGIAQARVRGVDFDVGVFTGLTRDHLDFHGDMDAYFEVKAGFVRGLEAGVRPAVAVVNVDDPWGRRLASDPGLSVPVLTYGRGEDADVRAFDVRIHGERVDFRAATPWGEMPVRLGLAGGFNVENALAALGVAGHLGCALEEACAALENAEPVPGRMETVPNQRGIVVIVDYAHTEDALARALQAARDTVPGRLVAVFGCGGDRDRGKRPLMAAAAARWADYVVVTMDNPRTENPEDIFHDIEAGFEAGQRFVRIPDRHAAIAYALHRAAEGDAVVIAGKGHEKVQEIGHTISPFDDRQVAADLLAHHHHRETTGVVAK